MIIKPYSLSTLYESGGVFAPTAANFPALKHFFPCNETAGSTTLTDSVGGVVATVTGLTNPATGAIGGGTISNNVALASGSWTAPGTKPTILFAVGQFGVGSKVMWMGDQATGPYFGLSGQVTSCTAADGSAHTIAGTALTGGAVYGIGMYMDWTNLTTFEAIADGSAAYSAKAPVAMTGWVSVSSGIASKMNMVSFTSCYGMAVFEFATALPGDIRSAITWMTYQWKNGNKAIYPGWAGLL